MESGNKLTWQAFEYEDKPKTADWFWALGIIGLSTVIASIIYGNYLFAVFILIAVSLLIIYSVRKPQMVTFEISERGVKAANYLYEYRSLKSFSIVAKNRQPKLLLETDRVFMPLMTVPLGDADWQRVRTVLLKKLEEKQIDEPASHKLVEFLGF